MSNGETIHNASDSSPESHIADSHLERLGRQIESSYERPKKDGENQVEKAKTEALETAVSIDKKNTSEKESKSSKTIRHGLITKKELNNSYKRTMKRVQDEMPSSGRMFSKFIHAPIIERSSELVGSTIARPNAILSGSVFAFLLTLVVYIISKNSGYVMSGFETIASFTIGWVLGLTYDYLRLLVTGKKS